MQQRSQNCWHDGQQSNSLTDSCMLDSVKGCKLAKFLFWLSAEQRHALCTMPIMHQKRSFPRKTVSGTLLLLKGVPKKTSAGSQRKKMEACRNFKCVELFGRAKCCFIFLLESCLTCFGLLSQMCTCHFF